MRMMGSISVAVMCSAIPWAQTASQDTAPATATIATGGQLFRTYCATCHGEHARGNGPLAEQLRHAPPDLTKFTARNGGVFPSERVYRVFVAHSRGYELFCPFATGCDAVQNSPYAQIRGIPVSLLGMVGFTAYIALALLGLRSSAATRGYLDALLVLSVMEVGFTSYMAYLQVAVIRAICSWCMFSAAVTVALAVLVVYTVVMRATTTGANLSV